MDNGPEFIVYSEVNYAFNCLEIYQVPINEMHNIEYCHIETNQNKSLNLESMGRI